MESIIEFVGAYKGHVFCVLFHSLGHRTGYVKVEPNDVCEDVYQLSVHGGVTYHKTVTPKSGQCLPPGSWIGFDCAHSWDKPDAYHCQKYFGKDPIDNGSGPGAEIRDLEFCEKECKKLIDQL